MKLVLSIVSNEDSNKVLSALADEGYFVTKLASTGGFLKSGNVTFLTGVEDKMVDNVIEIIRTNSKKRKKITATPNFTGMPEMYPVEVEIGGGTIFVLDIDRFEKV